MAIPAEPAGLLFKAGGQAGILSTGEQLGFPRTDGSTERVCDFGHPTPIGWVPGPALRRSPP
ncbi:MAG: hypothetical protein FJY95_21095 [Candidatus Handelsmanbacteria bacterium]|nr:hypothetical protein [Candidatus Handelsmanbacteria bacterium]